MPEIKGPRDGRSLRYDIMTQDEVTEYFSNDIEFDWPEAYEPPYPLTAGEARMLYSNHTGAVPLPLSVVETEEFSPVERIRKEMWSQPPIVRKDNDVFFDCLLDEHSQAVYNEEPVAVFEYLKNKGPFPSSFRVYVGKTNKLVTIEEYMTDFEKLH